MNIIKKYMFGMILRPIVMIGIWIVVISGMTTTFIFYLMTHNVDDSELWTIMLKKTEEPRSHVERKSTMLK
jgi:hypothetical protein